MSQRFWNKEGFPTELFRQYAWKQFNGEKWYHPLRHEIFRYPNYCDIPKCSTTKSFDTLSQKIFDGKSWYSVLIQNSVQYLTFETFWNFSWFLTKFFATVRQKKIEGKPGYAWKFPRSQVFWNLEVVPRIFSRTVRQKFLTEEVDFPFSCIESFDTRKVLDSWRRYPRNFLVLWGQKKSTENRDTPYWEVFDVLKILKHRGVPQRTLYAVNVT